MYPTNLGRPMVSPEVTKQHVIRAPPVQRTSSSLSFLRGLLLGWGFLRLVVSIIWTGVIIIPTVAPFLSVEHKEVVGNPNSVYFGAGAIGLQLVEFGMLITFIIAGVKKCASLYRAYYRYCILTLIIYVIAVTLCLTLEYDNGHYFGEIYLTYHINELPIVANDGLAFVVTAVLDVCLELFLILAVKVLIRDYSYNQNNAAGEYV